MKTSTNKSILAFAIWLALAPVLYPSSGEPCQCIVSAETKSAKIESPGETHCYMVWAEAGQAIVIEMAGNPPSPAFCPRLQLYGPDGVLVASSTGGDVAWIENYRVKKTGIHTIVAEGIASTGEYSLSLVLAPGATTSPRDSDGGNIAPGETKCGRIFRAADMDAYSVYIQVGQGIAAKMAGNLLSTAFYPRLRLYDPDGVLVAMTTGGPVAWIENYQAEKTGIYTIVASGGGASTGEYCLSATVAPPANPYGLYPYDPQPSDGNAISLCDPNRLFGDVVITNKVLLDGSVVGRRSGGNLLSWWSVVRATSYDVYFARSACLPLEKVAENIIDPWLPMPAVEPGQVCTWRVVAHTPNGDIKGPTWWFATERCQPHTLTISTIGRGSTDPSAGDHKYPRGETVSVTAVPDPNYEFVRWKGSAVDANKVVPDDRGPKGSKVSVTMDGDYTLTAVFEEVVFDDPLDGAPLGNDPNWTFNGQWALGVPKGNGGGPCHQYGYPDPTRGRTGQSVFGVNLNGDYDTTVGGPYWLVAGPFDLRSYEDVKLRFWRWLNTDEPGYVRVSVDWSIDGDDWRTLWQSETEIADSRWVLMKYSLGPEANGQPAVYLRWTYEVLRVRAYPYSGWNLDDIQLIGH